MNVASILKTKGGDVVQVAPASTLLEVARVLSEKNIGCAVVTDADGAIAGIVSERDIVRRVAMEGPSALDMPVTSCMTCEVVTCGKADTIEQVMAEMTNCRIRHIPVLEDQALSGLISIGDVVKYRIAEAEFEASEMRNYIAAG